MLQKGNDARSGTRCSKRALAQIANGDGSAFIRSLPTLIALSDNKPAAASHPASQIGARREKKFGLPLETKSGFSNFSVATVRWLSGALGARMRRAPVVSGASYPSCSLEDLAMRTYDSLSPVPIDHWFRSSVRPRGNRPAGNRGNPTPRTTSSGWPKTATRSRWRSPVSRPTRFRLLPSRTSSPSKATRPKRPVASSYTGGISTRHFKRQFSLADYVQVRDATFDNGLLKIELVREIPEAMKPRRIAINGASTADNVHQIEAKAA